MRGRNKAKLVNIQVPFVFLSFLETDAMAWMKLEKGFVENS